MLRKRVTLIFSLVGLVLVVTIGTSFAYLRATRTQTDKNKISTASCLQIDFVGEDIINIPNAYPIRDEVGLSQTPYKFTISNVCSQNIEVSLGFESLPGSTLPLNYVKGIMAKEGHLAEASITLLNNYPAGTPQNNGTAKLMLTDSIPGLTSKTYEYTMWIDYNVTEEDISPNEILNGKIIATYVMKTANTFTKYCYTDDYEPGMTMMAGTEYVNGQYTYRFRQETNGVYDETSGNYPTAWVDIDEDGWGVTLTDKTSTDPVTSELCTFVNDKPIVSMSRMFYESQAASIDFSSFITKNVTKMSSMFESSNIPTSIDLSGLDLSNVNGMLYMFKNSKFTNINMSNTTTKNVTNMTNMFAGINLDTIDLTNLNTSNVKNLGAMFQNAKVNNLLLPTNFDARNVTDLTQMFFSANVNKIDLSGLKTENVQDANYMFAKSKITSVLLPDYLDFKSATSLTHMFYEASIDNIDLSGVETRDVTSMLGMFQSFTSKNLTLPTNFDARNVTDLTQMFFSANVNKIDLSGFKTRDATKAEMMFQGVTAGSITITGDFDISKATSLHQMFFNANVTGDINLSGIKTRDATTVTRMFQGTTANRILIPSNFDLRKVTDMSYMFYSSKVKSIDLRGLQTRDVTTTALMFMYTTATSITFPTTTLSFSKVTNMSQMFFQTKLTSLNLTSFQTSSTLTDMHYMFQGTPATSITFSNKFVTSGVTNMQNLFKDNASITTLNITVFNTAKVTNMAYMFDGCSKLTTVYASTRWSTAKVTSSSNMFRGATKIKNYNKSYLDKTRAHYNTNGYFTKKDPPTS